MTVHTHSYDPQSNVPMRHILGAYYYRTIPANTPFVSHPNHNYYTTYSTHTFKRFNDELHALNLIAHQVYTCANRVIQQINLDALSCDDIVAACQMNDYDLVHAFHFFKPDGFREQSKINGMTPFLRLCTLGDFESAKLLYSYDFRILNDRSIYGVTALGCACRSRHQALISWIIQQQMLISRIIQQQMSTSTSPQRTRAWLNLQ